MLDCRKGKEKLFMKVMCTKSREAMQRNQSGNVRNEGSVKQGCMKALRDLLFTVLVSILMHRAIREWKV